MALYKEVEKQGNYLFKHRSNLPILILILGIIAHIHTQYSTSFLVNTPYENYFNIFALAVSFFGLAIRIYTVAYTPDRTSGRNTHGQVADSLNTTGIYSMVRHPLYVGNFFMWLGVGMLTQNPYFIGFFVFLYWVYYERIMCAEEQFLVNKFGEEYSNWADNTPAFILSFKNYCKPELSFCLKKVLRKEKDGFLAIFVAFYIFLNISNYIQNGSFVLDSVGWNTFFIFGLIIYLILKFIKKYTKFFQVEGR